MKTRFLAMLLAVLMIAGAALSVSAFKDVEAGNKHIDAITVLSQLGIVGGYEDGSFKPDQKVTRAEMAKLVYVLYTTFVDAGEGKTVFTDVEDNYWANGYINWCSAKGIIGGYGNGMFGPTDNVTYDQALKMVCGALGYTEWDSALWPVDVRMKALRELNLGANLDGVNGSAELTRAQVAQVIYNALDVDMNETKTVEVEIAPGVKFPVEQPKKLSLDVWKFVKYTGTIDATETLALDGKSATAKEDKITIDGEAVELKDLGLTAFEGKTDDLIGLSITTVARNGKLLPSATLHGSVLAGVKVTVASDDKSITVNGVKLDADDEIVLWDLDATITDDAIFGADKKVVPGFETLVTAPYLARVIDKDGDGDYDALVLAPKVAYEVTKVETKDNKTTITYKTLADATELTMAPDVVDIELKKGDVFAAATIAGKLYAEAIAPVEAYATKINVNDKKITLNGVGEVKFGTPTLAGTAAVNLTTAQLGTKNALNYYIYNGEVIKTAAVAGGTTDTPAAKYNFAILKEITKTDSVLNESTMTYEFSYVATLIVDGKEQKVTLAADKAVNDKSAAAAYDEYKVTTVANQPVYKYTVVSDFESTDKGYVLTVGEALENYKVIPAGATIKYNALTGLYTIESAAYTNNKVLLGADTKLYYTTTKKETGAYKYLAVYTKDTMTTKAIKPLTTAGDTYVLVNKDGTATLVMTLLANAVEFVEATEATPDIAYKTDGRLIVYAPVSAITVLGDDDKNYYEYVFMNNKTLATDAAVVDKTQTADKATSTVAGNLYAWNAVDKKYDLVDKDNVNAKDVIKLAEIKSVIAGMNLVEYKDGTIAKIADTVTIWGLSKKDDLDSYKAYTLADLAKMLEKAETLEVLLVSYKANGTDTIATIIVNAVDAEGKVIESEIFDNYKA